MPQLEKDMMMADSNEAIKENEEAIEKLKIEKEECENKVFEYKRDKDLKSAMERL